jgi:hypothetical protein
MKRWVASLIIGFACVIGGDFAPFVQAQAPGPSVVSGTVVDRASQGIPGLEVYLVHASRGRSYPSITNVYGYFSFAQVPVDSYYLEVYWSQDLLYRSTVVINGPVDRYIQLN